MMTTPNERLTAVTPACPTVDMLFARQNGTYSDDVLSMSAEQRYPNIRDARPEPPPFRNMVSVYDR